MNNDNTIRYWIRPYDTIWMLAQVFNTSVDSIMALNPGIIPTNLQIGQVITISPGYGRFESDLKGSATNQEMSQQQMDLNNLMRMLWEQHITWTRIVIMGLVEDLPDLEFTTERLLRNPQDFANAFRPFYGDEIAADLANLLTSHLTIAAELVQAAKAGNNELASEVEKRWYENADQLAAFFGSINPYWSEDDWKSMLYEHLALVKSEAVNMLTKNYAVGVDEYDEMERQALEMADMMAEGIMLQFPAGRS